MTHFARLCKAMLALIEVDKERYPDEYRSKCDSMYDHWKHLSLEEQRIAEAVSEALHPSGRRWLPFFDKDQEQALVDFLLDDSLEVLGDFTLSESRYKPVKEVDIKSLDEAYEIFHNKPRVLLGRLPDGTLIQNYRQALCWFEKGEKP